MQLDGAHLDVDVLGDVDEEVRAEVTRHRRALVAQDRGAAAGSPHGRVVHGLVVLVLVVSGVGEDDVRLEVADRTLEDAHHLSRREREHGVLEVVHVRVGGAQVAGAALCLDGSDLGVSALGPGAQHDRLHDVALVDQLGQRGTAGELEVVRVCPHRQHPARSQLHVRDAPEVRGDEQQPGGARGEERDDDVAEPSTDDVDELADDEPRADEDHGETEHPGMLKLALDPACAPW